MLYRWLTRFHALKKQHQELQARYLQHDMSDLDTLLRTRNFEPPSADLSQRIISEAARTPHLTSRNLSVQILSNLKDITIGYLQPAPAFAYACVIILGVLLGRHAIDVPLPSEDTEKTFETADNVNYQEWGAL